MNRKLKILGLAFVAALALTAVMASAAQAQFTSSAAHTVLSGSQTQTHKFTAGTGSGNISCATATFAGTAEGTSQSSMTITPTYANCKDSLGRTVHVVTNTTTHHFERTLLGTIWIITGHVQFTLTAFGLDCTITIRGVQENNGLTFAQSGNDLLLSTHTNNITSTISGGGFACGTSASHSSTGTYTGTTLIEGNGGAAKISVH